jgi:hypothetical protein
MPLYSQIIWAENGDVFGQSHLYSRVTTGNPPCSIFNARNGCVPRGISSIAPTSQQGSSSLTWRACGRHAAPPGCRCPPRGHLGPRQEVRCHTEAARPHASPLRLPRDLHPDQPQARHDPSRVHVNRRALTLQPPEWHASCCLCRTRPPA